MKVHHSQCWELQIVSLKLKNNDCPWIALSENSHISPHHRPCFLESIVTEQLTTCCCFYRQICHGDGCHPGRLPGASHPCSEDGRPLRARRASQTDVEAGGGGPAAGAGLNAELLVDTLVAGRPAPVICHPAGYAVLKRFLTNGKLPQRTEQRILLRCKAPHWEVWCKSDSLWQEKKQFILKCDD